MSYMISALSFPRVSYVDPIIHTPKPLPRLSYLNATDLTAQKNQQFALTYDQWTIHALDTITGAPTEVVDTIWNYINETDDQLERPSGSFLASVELPLLVKIELVAQQNFKLFSALSR
jgi:hypothetical protein